MLYYREPEIVRKARTKQKVTRTYKRVAALTDTMGKAVQINLVKGINQFKRRISSSDLLAAWKSGSYSKIMEALPWHKLYDDIGESMSHVGQAAFSARNFSIPSLPEPSKNELRYDTRNPFIENYLKKRTGELVINISRDTQASIQQAVARSYDQALLPSQVADMIRGSIGLHPRYEQAVYNYEQNLTKAGQDPEKVSELVSAYRERLIDSRAMTIARTETRNSSNQGQLSIWREAANNGLIDRDTSKKVWIVDGAPCEICEPMDGVAIPLDSLWTLNNGVLAMVPSDSHPNCLCGMEISYDNKPEEEE